MYCTIAQLGLTTKELIQLTDDSTPLVVTAESLEAAIAGGDLSELSTAVQTATTKALGNITDAINYAAMLINSNVGERYTLPLTTVPPLITTIAIDLAVWKIFYRRKRGQIAEVVQKSYDNSMKLLDKIRDGKITIGVTAAGKPVAPAPTGGVQIASGTPTFTPESLRNF